MQFEPFPSIGFPLHQTQSKPFWSFLVFQIPQTPLQDEHEFNALIQPVDPQLDQKA